MATKKKSVVKRVRRSKEVVFKIDYVKALLTSGDWVDVEATITTDGDAYVPKFSVVTSTNHMLKILGQETPVTLPFLGATRTREGEWVYHAHIVKFIPEKV